MPMGPGSCAMGLFLRSRTKTKGKSRGKAKAKPARGWAANADGSGRVWDPARAWRVARVSLWVGAIALVSFGGYIGYGKLIEHVGQQRRAAAVDVRMHGLPAWMGDERTEHLRQIVARRIAADPLDRDSLRQATAALRANPWIARVERIERRRGGVVDVHCVVREPLAVVGYDGRFHLVDAAGHLLPGRYRFDELDALGLLAITGIAAPPPRQAGAVWPGDDLAAALKLTELLAAQPYADQVRQIDIANFQGRAHEDATHVLLVTANRGGRVEWGSAPGCETAYEPTPQHKLALLADLHHRHKSIDVGGNRVIVYMGEQAFIHTDHGRRSVSYTAWP